MSIHESYESCWIANTVATSRGKAAIRALDFGSTSLATGERDTRKNGGEKVGRMSHRWLSATAAVVACSNLADAFVLGTSTAVAAGRVMAVGLENRTVPCTACRPRYIGDSLLEVAMAGRLSSLATARGASATLSGWRTAPATARLTMSRNRGRQGSSSGQQRGSWWRSGDFLRLGEGGGMGVAVARGVSVAEDDGRVSIQEKAVTPRANGSTREGRKGKALRSTVEAFSFVREGLARHFCKARNGISARIVGWRRGVSLALAGMAAVLLVMTASAGPASALLEKTRLNPDGTPRRLTGMPEEIYQQREALQEFCQSDPKDRLFDFNDLTTYEEELDKLDMFGDQVKVSYGTRESFRLKYSGYLEDYKSGGKTRGVKGALRLGFYGTLMLVVVTTCLNVVALVFKSFVSMAREEEVDLYGEEISVDATEKDAEELQETEDEGDGLGVDDDDLEDFAKLGSATPGGGPGPSGVGGDDADNVSEDAGRDEDDLLGA